VQQARELRDVLWLGARLAVEERRDEDFAAAEGGCDRGEC
jgi:hypothetical protein